MNIALQAWSCLVLLATLNGGATAQTQTRTATVYHCGVDGRDLRDSPCPNDPRASATAVEFDHPSAAQTRAASARAIGEAKQAQMLEAKRRHDEAQARRRASPAVGINGLATPAAAAAKPASAAKAPLPPKVPKAPKAPKLAKPHKPGDPASVPR